MEGMLLSEGLREKGESFYQENFTGESERHIKEDSENGQLSL